MSDIILSLDPSSTRSGWALMKPPEQLVRAGLLLPARQTDPSEDRIAEMCKSLWQILNLWQVKTILIEWTSGKTQKRHKGSGAGLAVHGAATGALWREVLAWLRWQPGENQLKTKVILTRENEWTRGVSKRDRAVAIAAMFPEYKIDNDPGLDIADSIGLAVWYLREQSLKLAECPK